MAALGFVGCCGKAATAVGPENRLKKNLASHKTMRYDSVMDVETQSARCLTPVA